MNDLSEKRSFKRYEYEMPIMYSLCADNPHCYYGAEVRNYSLGGLYFETNYPLRPGSVINIRRANYYSNALRFEAERTSKVRVLHCDQFYRKDNSYYGVRVKKLEDESVSVHAKVQSTPAGMQERPYFEDMAQPIELESEASRINRVDIINRILEAVVSTLDISELLQIICREMVRIFHARNAGIGLLNAEKTKLTIAAFHSLHDQEIDATGLELDVVGNVATLFVIQSGQAIIVPDVQNNPLTASIHDIARKRSTECLMIVPLKTREEVIGTIGLPLSDPNRIFTPADVSLAQKIANKIASAIENARRHAETEKAKNIAEHELKIARDIQAGFLPKELPSVPGWEIVSCFQAARQVAGDFFDVFEMEENNRVCLVIGDVCDKGVGAALFMALFRSLIRAFTLQSFPKEFQNGRRSFKPSEIISRTIHRSNHYIAKTHGEANMFATLFFATLDPQTGTLSYINCGHEPPVLFNRNRIKALLNKTGPVLGVFPDAEFSTKKILMNPGDMLLTYTDGVIDAQNETGDFFTRERVFDLLTEDRPSAVGLLADITTRLNRHISGSVQYDDITILAVRRLRPV